MRDPENGRYLSEHSTCNNSRSCVILTDSKQGHLAWGFLILPQNPSGSIEKEKTVSTPDLALTPGDVHIFHYIPTC